MATFSTPGAGAPAAKPPGPGPLARMQQGPPAAGVQRPMSCRDPLPTSKMPGPPMARVPDDPTNSRNIGAAFPTAMPHAPLPHMQQAPPSAMAPAVPTNSCTFRGAKSQEPFGPAIPPAKPQAPQPHMQQAPPSAMAPAVPTSSCTMGAARPPTKRHAPFLTAVPPAKRHAPLPSMQEAPTGGVPQPTSSTTLGASAPAAKQAPVPLPSTQAAPTGDVPLPTTSAPGAAAPLPPQVQTAAGPPRLTPSRRYHGVHQNPMGRWTAHVFDPELKALRLIGTFQHEHAAALAQDRVAIALHGDSARLNFGPAFYGVECQFLRRCQTTNGAIDICGIIRDGTYEAKYATFLRAVYHSNLRDLSDMILEFFICRAFEIGEEAIDAGGEKLVTRFVEMHRNKATNPMWREWYHLKIEQQRQQCVDGNATQPR